MRKAKVVTICGSTRFKDEINLANRDLTLQGYIVISMGVFGHTDLPDFDWDTDKTDLKTKLDQLHFEKIDMADCVLVVNPIRTGDNPGGSGYMGESTRREIAYARSQGKPVAYTSNGLGEVRGLLRRRGEWSDWNESAFQSRIKL